MNRLQLIDHLEKWGAGLSDLSFNILCWYAEHFKMLSLILNTNIFHFEGGYHKIYVGTKYYIVCMVLVHILYVKWTQKKNLLNLFHLYIDEKDSVQFFFGVHLVDLTIIKIIVN